MAVAHGYEKSGEGLHGSLAAAFALELVFLLLLLSARRLSVDCGTFRVCGFSALVAASDMADIDVGAVETSKRRLTS